jgi:polyhydroxybutyrate depolymerase
MPLAMNRSAVCLPIVLAACSHPDPPAPAAPPVSTAAPAPVAIPARPYALHAPPSRAGALAPLVVFLHGYGSTGEGHVRQLGLEAFADAHGFVLAYPDGTIDARGKRFWNATDACCDFGSTGVDDVAYIRWLVDDVATKVPVDSKRVYVFGHSNGGFFAHRLACDLAPRIAAAVSLAGAGWKDADRCSLSAPVSVLEIHGEADDVIRMAGGRVFDLPVPPYPSTRDTLAGWAARDGCTGALAPTGKRLDFDQAATGPDTAVFTYSGCPRGVDVALWSVAGGSHFPQPTHAALEAIWAWMAAHAKP